MKLILKEKKKFLSEEESGNEMLVNMKSSDFLKLTTDEELMDYLRDRYEASKMDYNPVKAGKLLLFLDSSGKVISHEGRNRSFANIMKNGENAMQKVILRTESGDINKIRTLSGQFDPSVTVSVASLEKIKDVTGGEPPEDILEIGNDPITFKTEIWPKGMVYPNGRVLDIDYKRHDGEKDSLFLLNQIYQKMYQIIRKQKGNPDFYNHEEVSDATDKYVAEKYIVTDEQGQLFPRMHRKNYYRMIYDRPTVGTITIQKK